MKPGLDLTAMATELERQANAKRDFIADTRELQVHPENQQLVMRLPSGYENFDPNPIFRRQISEHYRVPHDYAERLRTTEALRPLYSETFNTMFAKQPSRQMVRTLDGTARAFRSDRFRPLDNYDLAEAVLPVALAQEGVTLASSQFTDSRFYMKFVFPRLQAEIKKGDIVQMGLAISNSEVGMGSLAVDPLIDRCVCNNGMIVQEYGHKRYHVGKKAEGIEAAYEMYSDETKRLDDAVLFAKIRDTVKGLLNRDVLETIVAKMRESTEQKIEGTNIVGAVEVISKQLGYTEGTKHGVLKHLLMGGDLTRYGVLNAITRQSQDEADYETATRLERDGARIMEMGKSDWKQVTDAALAAA